MIFVPKLIDGYTIERVHIEGVGRNYKIVLGNGEEYLFPSMTTVLKFDGDPEYIVQWKKRVGEAAAYAKSTIATDAGTLLHEFCEYFLLRQTDKALHLYNTTKDRRAKFYMKKILPFLRKLKKTLATEEFLFTLKYKVAGTIDGCIVYEDGRIYILDFKTSSTMKDKDKIEDYYIQAAGYQVMFEEITGIYVEDIIIMMVSPYGVQEFFVKAKDYREKFLNVVESFYNKYGEYYQNSLT